MMRIMLAIGAPFHGVISMGVLVFISHASERGETLEATNMMMTRRAKTIPMRWKLLNPLKSEKLCGFISPLVLSMISGASAG